MLRFLKACAFYMSQVALMAALVVMFFCTSKSIFKTVKFLFYFNMLNTNVAGTWCQVPTHHTKAQTLNSFGQYDHFIEFKHPTTTLL